MRKIDSIWKGVYEGYLSVRKSQRQLELKWARAIKVTEKRIYQRQRQDWLAGITSSQNHYRTMKIIFPIVIVILFTCAVFSSILPLVLLSWGTAIFISLVLVGILIVQKVGINNLEKRPPVKTADGQKLINMANVWWNELKPPPIEIKKDGDEGEKALLDALNGKLSNSYIALHQYMVRQNLDADVLILGPNGIWLLESKFNSGTIICRNGEWTQEKHYYEPGGKRAFKRIPKKPYDKQWLAEKNSIIQTIIRRMPQDMKWIANEIKGGLVFTHNDITLDIDQSCQVEYGLVSYWVKKITTSPMIPNLTTEILLCVVDAVLEYASQISTETNYKSAKQLAINVFNDADANIPIFIKANL